MSEPRDHDAAGGLERLLRETGRLPVLHLLASFAVALGFGLVAGRVVLAVGSSGAGGGEPARLSQGQAIGQLTLQPVALSSATDSQFAALHQRVRDGEVGGALVVQHAGKPWDPGKVATRVNALVDAASKAGLPPPLVVLALEGIKSDGYCAPIPQLAEALRLALERASPVLARRRADALRGSIRAVGANVLLGTSLKDGGACGVPGRDGLTVRPRALVDSLRAGRAEDRVALVARGGQAPAQLDSDGIPTAKTTRYKQAGSHLWLVAAAMQPDSDPTWRRGQAVAALRDALRESSGHDVVIATPDLAAVSGPGGAAPPDPGAVGVALEAGADLVIASVWRRGGLAQDIRAYFDSHKDRLVRSCQRMRDFKRRFMGATNARECPRRG